MPLAHIVPKFLLARTYDEKNRNWTVRLRSEEELAISTIPIQPRRPGRDVDPELTCQKCESMISKWERYASRLIEGGPEIDVGERILTDHASKRKLTYFFFSKINYIEWRLFLLSMLWRASASTIELCNNVSLGQKHESVIQGLLRSGDPGAEDQYACVVSYLEDGQYQGVSEFVLLDSLRIGGHNCVEIVAGGFDFMYYVSNHKLPEFVRRLAVTNGGEMGIPLRYTPHHPAIQQAVAAKRRESSLSKG